MPYADRDEQLEYKRRWNHSYYRRNRKAEVERIVKRKKQIASWFLDYKKNLSCERCGENTTVCLDFHHQIHKKKDFSLATIRSWGWGIERIKKEVEKCAVLCANCHRKVHAGLS